MTKLNSKEFGKLVKKQFGRNEEVDCVNFYVNGPFVILEVSTIDEITHKQINSVLNQYPLGYWILIKTKASLREVTYDYAGEHNRVPLIIQRSTYRTSKAEAEKTLGL